MSYVKTISLALLLVVYGSAVRAQVQDSVDVLDYDISLDLSQESPFHGEALLTLQMLRPCSSISLDFVGTADSVEIDGVRIAGALLGALPTAGIAVGQQFTIRVWYHSQGHVESYGWGGFHFDDDMSYNLGVGFVADPHVMGRAVFPCRDNFHDKATYTLRVRTKAGWTAECGGLCRSVVSNDDGTESSVWRIDQPTPTYLVSVSQSNWNRIQDTVVSLHGSYPLTIGYKMTGQAGVRRAFEELDSVVPMYERCFGPYRWGRIGYIATEKGSMEHVNNIALDRRFIASTSETAQSTIAHELGHAWFGNLVTCATEGDMWFNEGGASFTSEVAMESVLGREASSNYYQRGLEKVLRTTHLTDNGYRALSGMPHQYTYGSTTYDKGWMVWHSLRGLLGEELFYSSMKRLMADKAFGNVDANEVRDSLSSYSGVDLTDFFDFHVFNPGFVDYHVELVPDNCPSVRIQQQGVGTDAVPRRGQVPVTFFGTDGTTMKGWFPVDSASGGGTLDVMYDVAFCVLDRDCEFSDAATVAGVDLIGYDATDSLPEQHIWLSSKAAATVYAEHHWGKPFGAMPDGVVRSANRYWILRGNWDCNKGVKGSFRYVRTGYAGSSYANLDRGFYYDAASRDSLALLYRANSSDPWHAISHRHAGNANGGWLVADSILPGEYTLAVVDTNILSLNSPLPILQATLFPNPLEKGQPFSVDIETREPFIVSVYDAGGHLVWRKTGCVSGEKLSPMLSCGTYFVRIENNFISLQSKLIQL